MMPFPSSADLLALAPQAVLAVGAVMVLLFSTLGRPAFRVVGELTLLVVAAAAWVRFSLPLPGDVWWGLLRIDEVSLYAESCILTALFVSVWIAAPFLRRNRADRPEFYSLLLLSAVGATLSVSATDALVLFLGLEVLSLPLAALTAFFRRTSICLEAGLKFFTIAAFSSVFTLFGIALLTGTAGTTRLAALGSAASPNGAATLTFTLGLACLIGGLATKLALVPFHGWAPDVYQGGPTPVIAFVSAAPACAVLIPLTRIINGLEPALIGSLWLVVGSALAIASQFFGGAAAIVQRDVKRILACIAISNIGFLMTTVVAAGVDGATGLLVSLAAFTLMNLGAFAAVAFFSVDEGEAHSLAALRGLGRRHPVAGFALSVCLLSLAGFPPLFGFTAKFSVLRAAVNADLVWLAVVGALQFVLIAFASLRVVFTLYDKDADSKSLEFVPSFTLAAAAALTAIGVALIGLYPTPILTAARIAAMNLVR